MEKKEFIVDQDKEGLRLDVYITEQMESLSRSQVQKLVVDGHVTLNAHLTKGHCKLKRGDCIAIVLPSPQVLDVKPQNLTLDVVFEDGDLIVINKPQGMVVHPANGNYEGTLVNALLYHCQDLSGINGVLRPGIVHRIDKDTSGLLVVAKNDEAHRHLAQMIKAHEVKREYLALVHGGIAEPAGVIDAPIGRDSKDRQKMAVISRNSREAFTEYHVLERLGDYTLIQCRLKTGRTHQIRVHMAYIKHPVVGDPKYGPQKAHLGLKGQALHAQTLGFHHPRNGEWLVFSALPPQNFLQVLQKLGSKNY